MLELTDKLKKSILDHARACMPRESCGLVILKKGKVIYFPCRNIATGFKQFVIDPDDYIKAEDKGGVVAVVHSHPKLSVKPSGADLIECEKSGIPWIIVNPETREFNQFAPTGFKPPLLGRKFYDSVQDCWSLIRDYYLEVLNIKVPDIERQPEWWRRGDNLYVELHRKVGFIRIDDLSELRDHDVVVMKFASQVPNHGAVFEKRGTIIHHQMNRLSSRDVYGGWYRKTTVFILRHESLC